MKLQIEHDGCWVQFRVYDDSGNLLASTEGDPEFLGSEILLGKKVDLSLTDAPIPESAEAHHGN